MNLKGQMSKYNQVRYNSRTAFHREFQLRFATDVTFKQAAVRGEEDCEVGRQHALKPCVQVFSPEHGREILDLVGAFADNGTDAVEKFQQAIESVGLLLIDVNMPLKNGWAAVDLPRIMHGVSHDAFLVRFDRDSELNGL